MCGCHCVERKVRYITDRCRIVTVIIGRGGIAGYCHCACARCAIVTSDLDQVLVTHNGIESETSTSKSDYIIPFSGTTAPVI